ncbi:SDR family NAD(P)-dependent oxidoreductase [Micromonospora carbonacea]|uniref:SDR family NAD(P)-dependent oxidoreductase n=1 Tax=Micromonospora carbonacea TaxID=47853 RepID=A0A7H8XLG8_9ACTN|nr:SDR family NAD(P)-dependent oxidoreductase [Micromonospora carbonacea]MBB5825917.1 NAD(P)-dependent dehydrogenase (short-subunit alcohol dehydrogenase family) [Micromonospora carbonacea]QLD25510.1 SDR family NAD(P)-dependent oxidoreductase [Micromonospora carbonacea]
MTEPPLALVTGATAGIGHAAVRILAEAGWGVLVHGRTGHAAALACRRIEADVPGARLWPVHADLASLTEVRALATRVAATHPPLRALINNAGLFPPNRLAHRRRLSADGYELTWAVNYLAPFALTTALMARTATVVNVGSGMLARAELRWDDLQHERSWDRSSAYGQSKLALVMFTGELAARAGRGRPVAVAVNPGYTDTRLVREAFGGPANPVEDGAAWVVRPLLDERVASVTGAYYDLGERTVAHPLATDRAAGSRLWDLTREQVEAALRPAPGPGG